MSWLFRSIQSDDADSSSSSSSPSPILEQQQQQPQSPANRGGGVKDDLSVIGDTIGRKLRGVANFLAPPPSAVAEGKPTQPDSPSSPSKTLLGIRNDLAELGGSLKTGFSMLSGNRTVSGISKLTSNFLNFENAKEEEEEEDDDGEGYAPGITREVIDFVHELSLRPECWIDFPLPLDNDFRMSDSQEEHASTVEHMVPSFRDLRTKVCSNMGVEQFWMVYFILLLPRLNEHDFEFLSTPQIVETRNILLQMLKNKRNEKAELSANPDVLDTSQVGSKVGGPQRDSVSSSGKEVAEIVSATEILEIDAEGNTDQWLEETDIETGTSGDGGRKLEEEEEEEEDVSFSDLEDDDNDHSSRLSASRKAQNIKAPSRSGSSDWEQLNKNSEAQAGLQKVSATLGWDPQHTCSKFKLLRREVTMHGMERKRRERWGEGTQSLLLWQ